MQAPRRLQLRRGNTAAISTYVGAPGELIVNTDTNTLYLHNGTTVGGVATSVNTSSITTNVSVLQGNILTLQSGITTLTSNAAVQSGILATLTGNAASQAGDIATLYANAGAQAGSIATLTSNAAVQSGLIASLEANAAIQAGLIAGAQGNYSNANVATYLPTYTGVVTASNVAVNGNVSANYFVGNGAFLTGVMTSTSHDLIRTDSFVLDLPNPAPPETRWANITLDNDCGQLLFQRVSGSSNYNYLTYTLDGSNPLTSGTAISVYLPNGATQRINVPGGATVKTTPTGGDNFSGAVLTFYQYRTYYTNSYSNVEVATYLSTYSGNIGSINLSANLGAISGTLTTLTGNAASQAGDIATIYANLGAVSGSIATLTSNAAIQAGLLDTLTGNAASQGGELASLVANAATQAGALATLTSNAASQSGTLADLIANAAVQAGLIASSTGTYSNANVASYLPTYSGNISANIVKNGNVWTFGTNGTTTFPTNISIDYSGGNVQFPRIIADSGKAFSVQAQGNTGSAALSWTVNPDAAGQYAAVGVTKGGGDNLAKVVLQAQSDSGDAATVKIWKFNETGNLTLPAGGTITEGVVTSNPTIQLTPATPTVASQKLVIKGGGSYSFTTNGININYYVNTGTGGDTLIFYVYSDTYANQTLYWWIYPVGVGMTTPDSGTVVLSGSGGNFSVGIDSDAYEFTVRVSPEADNYNAGSIGVESGLINADAPPFTSEHHLHLTTGNLTETSIFLGTDDHNVRTTTAGNIQITTPNTTNKVWEFGTNGTTTFSGNLVIAGNTSVFGINGALIQPANDLPLLALSSGANGAVASLWVEDIGNIGTSNIAAVYANPTPGSKIVRIAVGQNGVGSGPNLWDFGNTGTTQFPGSKILAPASQSITMQSDNYSQLMWENANLTVAPNMAINSNFYVAQNNATLDIGYRDGSSTQIIKSWYWNADGNLKLPSGGYILNSDDSIYGGSGSTYANANVASYLPTYSGNIAGNIVKNGYTWTFSNTGTTTFPTGVRLSNARGANTVNFTTDIDKSFQIETQTSTTGRLWSFGTDGNLTLPQNANINYSNGVSILSTVTDLYANAAVQAGNIATIFANLGATSGSLATLTANAASQAGSLATITSVLTSTNVAIGENAAYTAQGQYAVAIGLYAGGDTQGERAVAIGSNAGKTSQGAYAVAIGRRAGETSQGNNSIIINATTGVLNQTTANTFTVAPVRNDVANISQLMFYNTTSKEVTYGNTINIAGNVSTTGYFLGNGALLTGIVSSAGSYGNTEVSSFLRTQGIDLSGNLGLNVGSMVVETTGNIRANSLFGNIYGTYYFANGTPVSFGSSSTYSNANVATYLTNYDGDINFTSSVAIISNVDVITVLDHIRSPSYQYSNGVSILSGLGYGNTEVASYLPTYSGNITAGNVIATRFIGNTIGTTATYTSNVAAANLLMSSRTINSTSTTVDLFNDTTLNINAFGAATDINIGVNNAAARFGIKTPNIWFDNLANLATYSSNINVFNTTATGVNAFGTANTIVFGANTSSTTFRGNVTAANFVGNISITGNVTGTSANVTLQAGAYTSVFDNQGNVRLPTAYVTGNVLAGNVFVPGTSGQIGYSSGGFAQQATSNSTQVTSHFTSGNIQLMNINLGVASVHTVAFSCNKLTTNDMLIVKHIAGGTTSVYVDAYVASDGLAIIWMRNISGSDSGNFTPMLKYAIIQAPSA